MRIGGFQKTTLTDFPGKIAAIIFTSGCPFRCGFCHNPELVVPPFEKAIEEEERFPKPKPSDIIRYGYKEPCPRQIKEMKDFGWQD